MNFSIVSYICQDKALGEIMARDARSVFCLFYSAGQPGAGAQNSITSPGSTLLSDGDGADV